MKSFSLLVALIMALLFATSAIVESASVRTTFSTIPYTASAKKSGPNGQRFVKCKKGEECCVFLSSPKTECTLCSRMCP